MVQIIHSLTKFVSNIIILTAQMKYKKIGTTMNSIKEISNGGIRCPK